jgi:hypothetical protein
MWLTPWSRVVDNIIFPQPGKKFPLLYEIRIFIPVFIKERYLSLSWARSIQSKPPSYILKIHLDFRLSPWDKYWYFGFGVLQGKLVDDVLETAVGPIFNGLKSEHKKKTIEDGTHSNFPIHSVKPQTKISRSTLISFSHLHLGLISTVFHQVPHRISLCTSLSICATCPAQLLDLATRVIFCEQYSIVHSASHYAISFNPLPHSS